MKIRSQVGMVLNLDKCIGCHTCSVTCKNVWTGREGMEYAWFNNVETKPGIGYPKNWEDQQEWQGGWVRDVNGKIRPRLGGKMGVISKIFANPVIPQIDDYYEPFTFDYQHLHNAPESKHQPTARPRSLIDGKRMDKVIWGPNLHYRLVAADRHSAGRRLVWRATSRGGDPSHCASDGGFDRECRIERRSSDITFPFPGSPRPAGFNARCRQHRIAPNA